MKRIIAVTLMAALMLVSVSCGGKDNGNGTLGTTPGSSTSPTQSTTPEQTTPEQTTPEQTTPEQSTSSTQTTEPDEEYTAGDTFDFFELFTRRESYNGYSFVRISGENVIPFTYSARNGAYLCDNNHSRFYLGGDGRPVISSWNNNTAAVCFTAPVSGTYSVEASVHRWHNAAEGSASFFFMKDGAKFSETFITVGNQEVTIPKATFTLAEGESFYIVYLCGATGAGNDSASFHTLDVTLESISE
jgi:hypothetical protein